MKGSDESKWWNYVPADIRAEAETFCREDGNDPDELMESALIPTGGEEWVIEYEPNWISYISYEIEARARALVVTP